MSEASDEEPDPTAKRRACTLSGVTQRRLAKLAEHGAYGTRIPTVMTALIEAGIRQAIIDGFLDKDA